MEGHVVDGDAMDPRLRLGKKAEDADGMGADRRRQRGGFEVRADAGPVRVAVPVVVVVMMVVAIVVVVTGRSSQETSAAVVAAATAPSRNCGKASSTQATNMSPAAPPSGSRWM
jgi:hypothetical protein